MSLTHSDLTVLETPSASEVDIRVRLREAIVEEIHERGIGAEELAGILRLLPFGSTSLLSRSDWPIEVSLRVADALGMTVDLRAR